MYTHQPHTFETKLSFFLRFKFERTRVDTNTNTDTDNDTQTYKERDSDTQLERRHRHIMTDARSGSCDLISMTWQTVHHCLGGMQQTKPV